MIQPFTVSLCLLWACLLFSSGHTKRQHRDISVFVLHLPANTRWQAVHPLWPVCIFVPQKEINTERNDLLFVFICAAVITDKCLSVIKMTEGSNKCRHMLGECLFFFRVLCLNGVEFNSPVLIDLQNLDFPCPTPQRRSFPRCPWFLPLLPAGVLLDSSLRSHGVLFHLQRGKQRGKHIFQPAAPPLHYTAAHGCGGVFVDPAVYFQNVLDLSCIFPSTQTHEITYTQISLACTVRLHTHTYTYWDGSTHGMAAMPQTLSWPGSFSPFLKVERGFIYLMRLGEAHHCESLLEFFLRRANFVYLECEF